MSLRLAANLPSDDPEDDPPEPGAGPCILVADDEPGARDALVAVLHRFGYRTATAADGREAVERLKESQIDALVLDLQMPMHNGFETLHYVREHRRGLPTVLLTGLPPDEIQATMNSTDTANLPPLFEKPCDVDQLLDVLDMLLSGDLPTTVS